MVLDRGARATLPRFFLGIATSSSAMLFCAREPGCFTLTVDPTQPISSAASAREILNTELEALIRPHEWVSGASQPEDPRACTIEFIEGLRFIGAPAQSGVWATSEEK